MADRADTQRGDASRGDRWIASVGPKLGDVGRAGADRLPRRAAVIRAPAVVESLVGILRA